MADGTVITKFNYTVLGVANIYMTIRQGFSYNTFLQNQEKAHPGYVNMNDMARWVFTGNTTPSPAPCPTCPI
jgi:hypothetical protein